jgi:cytochrome b subunit of formate dehydrogenase
VALFGFGAALILANIIMSFVGLSASYNFGDPAQFEFFLVPFWQLGLAIAVIGVAGLILWRQMAR